MFTGLIEAVGQVALPLEEGRLWVAAPFAEGAAIGGSVAVNGCCLTVVASESGRLAFDLSEETVARTNLGSLIEGGHVNLERPLRAGSEIGGHFVQGHADGVGALVHVETLPGSRLIRFAVPGEMHQELIPKGSIALDGISLTVVDILPNDEFTVAVIPHTWENTTLSKTSHGAPVNVETDVLGKYVRRFTASTR